jgi:alkylated DNA nucleotide flippase Atl1
VRRCKCSSPELGSPRAEPTSPSTPALADTLHPVPLDKDIAVAFVESIPKGRWTTYGDVADAAGNRGAAKSIGGWLLESGGSIPFYWRVIGSKGEVPPGFVASIPGLPRSPVEARERLAAEGVTFDGVRASEQCRYTVEEWRTAGCPSGADTAAAHVLAELDDYVEGRIASLPERLEDLYALAGTEDIPAGAVAINRAIIARSPQDIPAHNRLGRAYQDLGLTGRARAAFETVLRLDGSNAIATKRLREISGSRHRDSGQG